MGASFPASAQTAPSGVVSSTQLSVLAKASVRHELRILNEVLLGELEPMEEYPPRQLKVLRKAGILRISEDYAYHKCIFDSDNIQTLISEELTLGHDELIDRSNSLNSVRDNYGDRLWRLVSKLCVRSQRRFEARLQNLTIGGKPLGMDVETAGKISEIFFYPTETGRPTLKKALIRTLYATVDAAYTIGSIQSLIGFTIGDIIVSLAFIDQSLMNFMLVDLPKLKIKLLELDPWALPLELRLDYTEEEKAVILP